MIARVIKRYPGLSVRELIARLDEEFGWKINKHTEVERIKNLTDCLSCKLPRLSLLIYSFPVVQTIAPGS
jgi:hypothetical protein